MKRGFYFCSMSFWATVCSWRCQVATWDLKWQGWQGDGHQRWLHGRIAPLNELNSSHYEKQINSSPSIVLFRLLSYSRLWNYLYIDYYWSVEMFICLHGICREELLLIPFIPLRVRITAYWAELMCCITVCLYQRGVCTGGCDIVYVHPCSKDIWRKWNHFISGECMLIKT